MIEFNWWGKAGSPPDNFKTKKQLYEIGLSPKEARAYIDTLKYRLLLYDINDPDSVKPKKVLSDKQKEARRLSGIQRQLKHFLPEYKSRLNELTELSEWALNTLDKRFLLLDTETTGLDFAEVVEIAIINHNKEVLLNTLVKPLDPIPDEAIAIHGITNEMVETATSFASIHHDLYHLLLNQKVLIYNSAFDNRILKYNCYLNNLPFFQYKSECLMKKYAIFYGEYSEYYDDYKWQKLDGGHRALADCFAAFERLEIMAQNPGELIDFIPDYFLSELGKEIVLKVINSLTC